MAEAITHLVRKVDDGHFYRIGDKKYQRQKDKWEIVETTDLSAPKAPVEEASVLKQIEEFTKTDVNLEGLEEEVRSEDLEAEGYYRLKELAQEKGYEIKGNPKKEDLIKFLSEAAE
jgi:hypothetical protein